MEEEDRPQKMLRAALLAIAWQILPVAWCAISFDDYSMLPGTAALLLVIVPLVSGLAHRNRTVAIASFLLALFAMLMYAALFALIVFSAGPAPW